MKEAIVTAQDIDTLLATDSINTKVEIVKRMENRIAEIMQLIFAEYRTHSSWWDWGFTDENHRAVFENNNITPDKSSVKIYVETNRELSVIDKNGKEIKISYENLIPTRWLWEDCEQEIKDGITAFKAQKVQKQQDQARRKQEMNEEKKRLVQSALSKLTDEEKWAVGHGRLPKSLAEYRDIESSH